MSTDARTHHFAEPSPAGHRRQDLPLFRFGLRQLLVFVALICLVLGAVVISGGVAALALLLGAMVVLFHLFSTALGSQLRFHANRTLAQQGMPESASESAHQNRKRPAPPSRPLARSPWYGRGSTPLPYVPKLIIAMSSIGGLVGAVALSAMLGERTSLGGIVIGSLSIAIVAGWFGFLAGSFYGILRHGLLDATSDRQEQQRP